MVTEIKYDTYYKMIVISNTKVTRIFTGKVFFLKKRRHWNAKRGSFDLSDILCGKPIQDSNVFKEKREDCVVKVFQFWKTFMLTEGILVKIEAHVW